MVGNTNPRLSTLLIAESQLFYRQRQKLNEADKANDSNDCDPSAFTASFSISPTSTSSSPSYLPRSKTGVRKLTDSNSEVPSLLETSTQSCPSKTASIHMPTSINMSTAAEATPAKLTEEPESSIELATSPESESSSLSSIRLSSSFISEETPSLNNNSSTNNKTHTMSTSKATVITPTTTVASTTTTTSTSTKSNTSSTTTSTISSTTASTLSTTTSTSTVASTALATTTKTTLIRIRSVDNTLLECDLSLIPKPPNKLPPTCPSTANTSSSTALKSHIFQNNSLSFRPEDVEEFLLARAQDEKNNGSENSNISISNIVNDNLENNTNTNLPKPTLKRHGSLSELLGPPLRHVDQMQTDERATESISKLSRALKIKTQEYQETKNDSQTVNVTAGNATSTVTTSTTSFEPKKRVRSKTLDNEFLDSFITRSKTLREKVKGKQVVGGSGKKANMIDHINPNEDDKINCNNSKKNISLNSSNYSFSTNNDCQSKNDKVSSENDALASIVKMNENDIHHVNNNIIETNIHDNKNIIDNENNNKLSNTISTTCKTAATMPLSGLDPNPSTNSNVKQCIDDPPKRTLNLGNHLQKKDSGDKSSDIISLTPTYDASGGGTIANGNNNDNNISNDNSYNSNDNTNTNPKIFREKGFFIVENASDITRGLSLSSFDSSLKPNVATAGTADNDGASFSDDGYINYHKGKKKNSKAHQSLNINTKAYLSMVDNSKQKKSPSLPSTPTLKSRGTRIKATVSFGRSQRSYAKSSSTGLLSPSGCACTKENTCIDCLLLNRDLFDPEIFDTHHNVEFDDNIKPENRTLSHALSFGSRKKQRPILNLRGDSGSGKSDHEGGERGQKVKRTRSSPANAEFDCLDPYLEDEAKWYTDTEEYEFAQTSVSATNSRSSSISSTASKIRKKTQSFSIPRRKSSGAKYQRKTKNGSADSRNISTNNQNVYNNNSNSDGNHGNDINLVEAYSNSAPSLNGQRRKNSSSIPSSSSPLVPSPLNGSDGDSKSGNTYGKNNSNNGSSNISKTNSPKRTRARTLRSLSVGCFDRIRKVSNLGIKSYTSTPTKKANNDSVPNNDDNHNNINTNDRNNVSNSNSNVLPQ
eukprot:Awhi_evm1s6264